MNEQIEAIIEAEVERRLSERTVKAPDIDGKPYVVVRCYGAGVHVGYLDSESSDSVRLTQSRRCWKFYGVGGTGSCSELALHGPDASRSRITEPVEWISLRDAIEVLPVTAAAKDRIDACSHSSD